MSQVSALEGQVSTLESESSMLMSDISALTTTNTNLMNAVMDLQDAADVAAAAALVEDWFFVNENTISIPADIEAQLIPAFCVSGPGVFKFELAVSANDAVDDFVVMLLINDVLVAQAEVDDFETPSSLSLIYRGMIDDVSDVKVIAMSTASEIVLP